MGNWKGPACGGDYTFSADGTFELRSFTPGGNTLTGTYLLNGVKLWTTNGVVAELVVVMARVPKSEGHRGGVTAFIVEADSPGISFDCA